MLRVPALAALLCLCACALQAQTTVVTVGGVQTPSTATGNIFPWN